MQQPPHQGLQYARPAIRLPMDIPDENNSIRAEKLLTGAEGDLDGQVGGDLHLQGVEDHAWLP